MTFKPLSSRIDRVLVLPNYPYFAKKKKIEKFCRFTLDVKCDAFQREKSSSLYLTIHSDQAEYSSYDSLQKTERFLLVSDKFSFILVIV